MNKIKLFFAGDFCSKPSTSVITVSDELRQVIQSCDLRVVNFEVPLKPEVEMPPQKRERFFQNDDAPGFLGGLGFNLFSLANNHAFDWGDKGFKKTKEALGDAAFGAGTYDEAYRIKVVEVNGVRIGYMALSFAAYTGVFDDVSNHEGLGCAYIHDLRVNHDIIEAKKNVDYLFVLPHDGIEYINAPLPETMARYRDFIDYGADGVIGTHPHCPQGWEEYKGKPIFYSIGNFFFNSKATIEYKANKPHWYEGLCVVMTIDKGNISWNVINIRNVDNLRIEVDNDKVRNDNNDRNNMYLKNSREYYHYLSPILKRQADEDLQLLKKSFSPNSVKEVVSLFLSVIRGRGSSTKEEMCYLLKNELKKNRLVKRIKTENNS